MKKICLVMYVFGNTYQDYIPLFLLSLFRVYPDYGVRIYLDRRLSENVLKNMNMFSRYDVTIIENYDDGLNISEKARKNEQISKCIRWLVYDKAFEEYQAIYIGDIDILFFSEKNSMFEEHWRHCEFLKKPYSNICRVHKPNKSFKLRLVARNFLKFGITQSVKFYVSKEKTIKKLSGLHFMKTKEYFPKMLTIREKFVDELNFLSEGKSKRYNLCSFNNESMLYDLMLDCGFGDIEESELGYNISDCGEQLSYRPHHGIHLGIFRQSGVMKNEASVINSQAYKDFYKQFSELEETSEYQHIQADFSDYMQEIINNMKKYYETNL